jgi:hypothetical protein
MSQSDGPAAGGALELGGTRKAVESHVIEAVAADPRARRHAGGVTPNRRQELGHVAEVARIEVALARRQAEEVQVRVDQAGQHGRALAVDPDRTRPGRIGGPRADRDDAAADDRDRRRRRAPRVARQDARVLEDDGDGISPTKEAASLP